MIEFLERRIELNSICPLLLLLLLLLGTARVGLLHPCAFKWRAVLKSNQIKMEI
jgi:hypothetical protein